MFDMKGVIAACISELVKAKFGEDKWKNILRRSGLDENLTVTSMSDIEDKTIFSIVDSICKELNVPKQTVCDEFGAYWVNTYAKRIYGAYYMNIKSAKDFILKMDEIHVKTTKNIANSRPPRFDIEHVNDNTIIVTYKSSRNMIDFYIGLVKGVGIYFKKTIGIKKISEQKVQLTFD